MIGKKYNFQDTFYRDLTICVLAHFEDKIGWVNRFSSGDVQVDVPVFYSVTGKNDDFLLDSFVDDISGSDRKVELNTDQIPRMHVTLDNWQMVGSEFANPNVYLRQVLEDENEIRKVLAKVRSIPIRANFKGSILLSSELDVFKASESIMNSLMFFDHIYFEFNFMHIDCVLTYPEETPFEIKREFTMEGDDIIKIDFSFTAQTYYPAYGEKQIWGKPKKSRWINQLKQGIDSNNKKP